MRSDEIHDAVSQRLRQADQRYTPGRRRLVELLQHVDSPVTLPRLLAEDPTIAQSSAYRNLAVLEQVGVVSRIVTRGGFASYELAEDLTGDHHHHLVCTGCGDVSDFSLTPAVERQLDKVLTQAAEAAAYDVAGHRLDVVGLCPSCQ